MPAKNKYHNIVIQALEKDGWVITDDPLSIEADDRTIQIDLGAEKLIGAEKDGQKIVVERKSFLSFSPITDFYGAIGQFLYYRTALQKAQPERVLYLAVPSGTYTTLFKEPLVNETVEMNNIQTIVYNIKKVNISLWTKEKNTKTLQKQ